MKVTPTKIPDLLIVEPKVFGDARGFFYESFNQAAFAQATGVRMRNLPLSRENLRGAIGA